MKMIQIVSRAPDGTDFKIRNVVADRAPTVLERLYHRRREATAYDDNREVVGAVIRHPDPQTYHNGRRWVTFRWTWYCWNYDNADAVEEPLRPPRISRHPPLPGLAAGDH